MRSLNKATESKIRTITSELKRSRDKKVSLKSGDWTVCLKCWIVNLPANFPDTADLIANVFYSIL